MRILVVEDEPKMLSILKRGLERAAYAVDPVSTGEDAIWMARENDYDCIVLDVGIPEPNGFDVSRALRAEGRWAPILLLTVRDSVSDRVRGLDSGADDYLTKPFAFDELLARIRALTRRAPAERPANLECGKLVMDRAAREVTYGGAPVSLTPREYAILEFLMLHAGEVVTRSDIMEHVWDFAFDGTSNIVDVYIGYLRRKVDEPFGGGLIETIRGVGYRLNPKDT